MKAALLIAAALLVAGAAGGADPATNRIQTARDRELARLAPTSQRVGATNRVAAARPQRIVRVPVTNDAPDYAVSWLAGRGPYTHVTKTDDGYYVSDENFGRGVHVRHTDEGAVLTRFGGPTTWIRKSADGYTVTTLGE